jgi:nucleotide-binding universal stress UspA family protein
MRPAHVIVGVDGSPQSRLALRWAAAEAARRGIALQVLHAFGPPGPAESTDPDRAANAAGERVVAAAVADVQREAPGVTVTGVAVRAGAAAALLAAGRPGDLVVVGHRAHSELVAILAGSTCQQVAAHAATSVAIVRGRLDPAGPVVVGFDGSAAAEAILDSAFAAAAARGGGLTVVRAFRPGTPPWPAEAPPPVVYNGGTSRAATIAELERIVAPRVEKYPDVAVELAAVGGDAAQALVDASHRAQLVVVGSRGHGGFTGLLLGSVGMHLTHHADCPVLISR